MIESATVLTVIVLFPVFASSIPPLISTLPIASEYSSSLSEWLPSLSGWKIATGLMLAAFGFAAANVIRSYVSGLLYFAAITMHKAMQVGDRVTIGSHAGEITRIEPLFIQLVTIDDDLVTIPTAELWTESVVSSNAGARASLSVMEFRIASYASRTKQQQAEDSIWEAIHASAFSDLAQPVQIYLSQEPNSILITAKAYVGSTYCELDFQSDVTRAFLQACDENGIPLSFDGFRIAHHWNDEDERGSGEKRAA